MMSSQEDCMIPLYGEVTHVMDPNHFWLRIGTEMQLKNFRDFEKNLNPAVRQLPVGWTDSVVKHSFVLVYCWKEGKKPSWKRATVIRTDRVKNMFDVFYMDYGKTEIVPGTSICPEVPDDIQHYPTICYRCALAGIQPIARSWTSRGVRTFEKLVSKQQLKVALVSYDHCTMSHRVALYSSDSDERSVTHLLLDAETGLPTEEAVMEYAKDVIPVSFEELYACNMEYAEVTDLCSEAATGVTESQETDHLQIEQTEQVTLRNPKDGAVQEEKFVSPLEVVVPGFDLSVLKCRMMSAEELRKEREAAQQAERKAKLQCDLIKCLKDPNVISMHRGGQKWGKTDLLIGQHISENSADCMQNLPIEDEELVDNELVTGLDDADIDSEEENEPMAVRHEPEGCQGLGKPLEEIKLTQSMREGRHLSFQPPPPGLTAEQKEYHMQKQFKQMLHEGFCEEEYDVMYAQFHSIVPVDADHFEDDIKPLIQFLLKEAVEVEEISDRALAVLNTYSGILRGTELLSLLKCSCDKFVTLPVGKMPRHHTSFASVIIRLLYMALDWPLVLKTVVEDFSVHCVEKWIIFNKKGTQVGLIQRQLEKIYLECAEMVLPSCLTLTQITRHQNFQFIFQEMRKKVLETDVNYEVRSRLLTMLMKFGENYLEPNDKEGRTVLPLSAATTDVAVQVVWPFSALASPSLTYSSSASRLVENRHTADCSSQTEAIATRDGGMLHDAAVQTETMATSDGAIQTELAFRRQSSESSNQESLDHLVTAAGRARRRRAVVEHLHKRENERSHTCSSPDLSLAETTVAGWLLKQTTLTASQTKSEPITVTESSSSARTAALAAAFQEDKTSQTSELNIMCNKADAFEEAKTCQMSELNIMYNKAETFEEDKTSQMSEPNVKNLEYKADENEARKDPNPSDSSANLLLSAISSLSRNAWQSVFGARNESVSADEAARKMSDGSSKQSTRVHVPVSSSAHGIVDCPGERADHRVVDTEYEEKAKGNSDSYNQHCYQTDSSASAGITKHKNQRAENLPDSIINAELNERQACLTTPEDGTTLAACAGDNDIGQSALSQGHAKTTSDNNEIRNYLHTVWDSCSDEDSFSDGLNNSDTEEYYYSAYSGPSKDTNLEVSPRLDNDSKDTDLEISPRFDNDSKDQFLEDFPPLTAPLLPTFQYSINPPLPKRHTLQSIAASLVQPTPRETAPELGHHIAIVHKEIETPRNKIRSRSEFQQFHKESETSFSFDKDLPTGVMEEFESAPSDWEDRLSSDASLDDSKQNLVSELESRQSASENGDGLRDNGGGLSHQVFNVSGNLVTAGSLHPDRSLANNAQDSGLGDSCVKNNSSRESESVSSANPVSLDNAVPYERGDLSFMANERVTGMKKRKKVTYRPLFQKTSALQVNTEPRAKWVPTEFTCTNCQEKGHMRSNCTKPFKPIIIT